MQHPLAIPCAHTICTMTLTFNPENQKSTSCQYPKNIQSLLHSQAQFNTSRYIHTHGQSVIFLLPATWV